MSPESDQPASRSRIRPFILCEEGLCTCNACTRTVLLSVFVSKLLTLSVHGTPCSKEDTERGLKLGVLVQGVAGAGHWREEALQVPAAETGLCAPLVSPVLQPWHSSAEA